MSQQIDPIFEMYLYESTQMIEQTEAIILQYNHASQIDEHAINEIFRCMHTLKGSSAMMQYENITEIAHNLEDIIHFIREYQTIQYNPESLSNLILESIDYFKSELISISAGNISIKSDAYNAIKNQLITFLQELDAQTKIPAPTLNTDDSRHDSDTIIIKQRQHQFSLHIMYTDDCEMENIRSYQLLHHLSSLISIIETNPADLIGDEHASSYIKNHGFSVVFNTNETEQVLLEAIEQTSYIKSVSLRLDQSDTFEDETASSLEMKQAKVENSSTSTTPKEKSSANLTPKSSILSVNVQKLDKLMDLVGELVIAEAMVANTLKSFADQSHGTMMQVTQLSKITSDLQDTIMSIRMVPLSPVFHKMRRITRDMCQKLNKEATIEIIGEETEIDKSVIDQISDPLMHIIRNSIDHGIEAQEVRIKAGKSATGKITIEAKNIGSDVLLIIRDDGRGIDKQRIFEKAVNAGLVQENASNLSDRDIYQFIFHPGLSTKEEITEFSGRGVGMDVVASNIEHIGGTIYIESEANVGTAFTIKIPLTLAIIDGMNVRVGNSHFTVPTTSIKESFRPAKNQIFPDISGESMVMVRGEIYNIVPLYKYFSIDADHTLPVEAILLMIEQEQKTVCIQVDELVGQQQVVIKPLPEYLKSFTTSNRLSGCTLLGNGNISMILNINELVQHQT